MYIIPLISALLIANPKYRLGSKSIIELKEHKLFEDYDWDKLSTRDYPSIPFVPDSSHANCDGVFDVRDCLGNEEVDEKLPMNKQELFNVNTEIK